MIREIEGVRRQKNRNRSQRKKSEDVTTDLEDRGRWGKGSKWTLRSRKSKKTASRKNAVLMISLVLNFRHLE